MPGRVSEVDSAAQDQHAGDTQEHHGGDGRSAGQGEEGHRTENSSRTYVKNAEDKHSGQRGQKGLTGSGTTLCSLASWEGRCQQRSTEQSMVFICGPTTVNPTPERTRMTERSNMGWQKQQPRPGAMPC